MPVRTPDSEYDDLPFMPYSAENTDAPYSLSAKKSFYDVVYRDDTLPLKSTQRLGKRAAAFPRRIKKLWGLILDN